MKAIYGALGKVTEKEIDAMGTRLLHRGKRQTVKRVSKNLFFGSASHNSESDHTFTDGRFTIVADAALYNRAELADSLARSDSQPKTDSNEEIILNLYKRNEIAGLNKINGSFAFAIWDELRREIAVGRDFFGFQPLFYTVLPSGGVAFSSEYKGLLALSAVSFNPDREMIQHLQNCKKLPIGRTLLRNVYSVPPGSLIVLNESGVEVRRQQMPKLALNIVHRSEKEASEKVKDALFRAIECRVDSQQPIGIALGGGIDSIGLVCVCRSLYPNAEIHTFTAGYGRGDSDLLNAARVAKAMNTIHHEVSTPPLLLTTRLTNLVWHLEDPYARSESLQLYELAGEARNFVPALISAQGADGLFGGMPRAKILSYVTKAEILRKSLEEFYTLTQIGVRPRSLLGRTMDALYFRGTVAPVPKVVGTSYSPEPIKFPIGKTEFVNQMLVNGFQAGQSQDIPKFEKSLAAWGIAYSSPFYDRSLVETAYSIPECLKIKGGIQKYILRKALFGVVPDGLLNVPKLPQRMNYDLEFSNVLDQVAAKYLSNERVKARGFFRVSDIERLKRRKSDAPYSPEGGMRLWTALLTEIWAIEFLDNRGSGTALSAAAELDTNTENSGTAEAAVI